MIIELDESGRAGARFIGQACCEAGLDAAALCGARTPQRRAHQPGIASNSNFEFEFRRAITEILRMDKAAKKQEWESKQAG
jgi:hypothetical protein